MSTTVILGAQWGDEGKGKLVDVLAGNSDWVARFQGGNNAGHTVVIGDRTIKLHLLPSGITRESCQLILGDGMVIDPWVLDQELERWKDETGEEPDKNRLFISDRAHIILKFHRLVDGLDKKYHLHKGKFINKENIIDPKYFNIRYKVKKQIKFPYLKLNNKQIPIMNLHMHSKNTKKFINLKIK